MAKHQRFQTQRMGQFWQIINLDRQEYYRGARGKMGEWFFNDQHELLVEYLRAEAPISFPNMIFNELGTGEAVLYLAITCKALLEIFLDHHFLKLFEWLHPNWEGCRVICLGDYMKKNDTLPPGVLTKGELGWIAKQKASSDSYYDLFKEHFQDPSRRYLDLRVSSTTGLGWEYFRYKTPAHMSDNDMLYSFHTYRRASLSSDADSEVLCNVSKHEYVKKNKLTAIPGCVTLAHALITLICWSPCADYALYYKIEATDRMNRGRWAGDRFRIVSEEAFKELKTEDWMDITKDVHAVLQDLCKCNAYSWSWFEREQREGNWGIRY
ncbi:hypothetical protein GY45DRAFT_1361943 [Cubamyces sp. BRFM 1775]|nr:hypothetical protein GY45DRAFT_1361943 [Cubamyces sp. BRFM 1775]